MGAVPFGAPSGVLFSFSCFHRLSAASTLQALSLRRSLGRPFFRLPNRPCEGTDGAEQRQYGKGGDAIDPTAAMAASSRFCCTDVSIAG